MSLLRVYGDTGSGNCYKVQLLLSQIDIEHEWVPVNVLASETQTPEFLAMNPVGKIPTVVLPDGRILSESNAILCYLAEDTHLLPVRRYERAVALQWLFFEQYSHEPYIAVARFLCVDQKNPDAPRLPELREKGRAALDVMEQRLSQSPFLVGNAYSIADIALYAYTHCAADGGFDLGGYKAVSDWLQRVRKEPGHIAMTLQVAG